MPPLIAEGVKLLIVMPQNQDGSLPEAGPPLLQQGSDSECHVNTGYPLTS